MQFTQFQPTNEERAALQAMIGRIADRFGREEKLTPKKRADIARIATAVVQDQVSEALERWAQKD